jgi:hypothetical protein
VGSGGQTVNETTIPDLIFQNHVVNSYLYLYGTSSVNIMTRLWAGQQGLDSWKGQ